MLTFNNSPCLHGCVFLHVLFKKNHQTACLHSIVLHVCMDVSSYRFWLLIFNHTDHNSSVSHCREKFRTDNCIVQVHPVYATAACVTCYGWLATTGHRPPSFRWELSRKYGAPAWVLHSLYLSNCVLCPGYCRRSAKPWANVAATIIGFHL